VRAPEIEARDDVMHTIDTSGWNATHCMLIALGQYRLIVVETRSEGLEANDEVSKTW
jgi:hypothetical protein